MKCMGSTLIECNNDIIILSSLVWQEWKWSHCQALINWLISISCSSRTTQSCRWCHTRINDHRLIHTKDTRWEERCSRGSVAWLQQMPRHRAFIAVYMEIMQELNLELVNSVRLNKQYAIQIHMLNEPEQNPCNDWLVE
jgi:hypothetical protein